MKATFEEIRSLLFVERSEYIKVFKEVPDLLDSLSAKCKLSIVTSNDSSIIKTCLKRNNLDCFFDFVKGNIILGGKTQVLKNLAETYLDPANSYYIGDAPGDIKNANEANLTSVAACWGYTGKELLEKQNPSIVLEKINGILSLI